MTKEQINLVMKAFIVILLFVLIIIRFIECGESKGIETEIEDVSPVDWVEWTNRMEAATELMDDDQRVMLGYETEHKTTGSHNTYISRPAAKTGSAIGTAPLKSMPPQNAFEGAIIGHGEPSNAFKGNAMIGHGEPPKRHYRRGSGPPPNIHEPVLTNEELTRKIESLERRLNKLEKEKKDAK